MAATAGSQAAREEGRGLRGDAAVTRVGEDVLQVCDWHPGHLIHFRIRVREPATLGDKQEVVHRLVYTTALRDEPVINGAEIGADTTGDSRFLSNLANRSGFNGLAWTQVPLWEATTAGLPNGPCGR